MDSVTKTMPTDRTVEVGVFATVDEAENAVRKLLGAGIDREQVSVLCSDKNKERYFREFEHQEPAGTFAPRAVLAGGTVGALLGGLPVLGAAVLTGSLVLWVAGSAIAWASGVAGGLVGAMMTRGVERELANYYQQAVLDGLILVAVEANTPNRVSTLSKAAEVFAAAGTKPLPLRAG